MPDEMTVEKAREIKEKNGPCLNNICKCGEAYGYLEAIEKIKILETWVRNVEKGRFNLAEIRMEARAVREKWLKFK